MKGDALKELCIKDVMVWAISHDDKNGTYAKALLKGLGKEVSQTPKIEAQPATEAPPKAIKTCRWVRQRIFC